MKGNFDFSGYATKNDLKCSDGRVIRQDAFKDNDGTRVPLVWAHLHNEPKNILGHAMLENRSDGVYAYCVFNSSTDAQNAKLLVQHGDIVAMSIYANELVEKAKSVLHGVIREVSLVLSGANPGALIDNLTIAHGDGTESPVEDEAIIFTGEKLLLPEVAHADSTATSDKSAKDIFNSLSDEQKTVVYAMIAEIMDENMAQSAIKNSDDKGDEIVMKNNVFDKKDDGKGERKSLTHADVAAIFADAQKCGSLKEAVLAHEGAAEFLSHETPPSGPGISYGVEHLEYLFPDARTVTPTPAMISRRMEWVAGVINGTTHTPFSRIKSLAADITADAARALGYVKGNLKKEEVIKLLRRLTSPTTIYKKQKLDRDDIIDITDFDVVSWMKAEMRVMLDEELARAVLIGDGRAAESEDKIDESCIRPIASDDDMYAHKVVIAADNDTDETIDDIIRARENYKGSGSPAMYCTTALLTEMLLLKADGDGRRMYATQAELEATLRVSRIIEVPVMEDVTVDVGDPGVAHDLLAIIVNLKDYSLGADKGGNVSLFDDFDIDYNQYKYLIETRCSGALVLPKSALVIVKAPEGGA